MPPPPPPPPKPKPPPPPPPSRYSTLSLVLRPPKRIATLLSIPRSMHRRHAKVAASHLHKRARARERAGDGRCPQPGGARARPSGCRSPTQVALVLQGGGALGAYQAGVVEGLEERGIEVDWVAGISIGAVNAAIFAGNPPERRVARLRGFWEKVTAALPALPFARRRAMARMDAHGLGAVWSRRRACRASSRPRLLPPALAPAKSVGGARASTTARRWRRRSTDSSTGICSTRPGPALGRRGRCRNRQFPLFRHAGRTDAASTRGTSWPRARCRRACRRSRSTAPGGGTAASSPTRRSAMCSTSRTRTCSSSRSISSPRGARCRRRSWTSMRARRTSAIRAAPGRSPTS